MRSKEKTELHTRIGSGDCRIVIGTHALIQDKLATKDVGLVIIDEQHRFGVEQRQKLRSKAGLFPHVLSMTATPVPRTLALTLYGELDISVLKTMPPGRKVTETHVVLFPARAQVYERVSEQIAAGRQAFVVAPLIAILNLCPPKLQRRWRKSFKVVTQECARRFAARFNEGRGEGCRHEELYRT